VVWNEEKEKMEVVPLAEAKAKQRFLDYVNSGGVDDGTDEEVEEEEEGWKGHFIWSMVSPVLHFRF